MREVWLQIERRLPTDQKKKLLSAAMPLCDVVIVDENDVDMAKQAGLGVIVAQSRGDIELCGSDKQTISKLKTAGKKVAVKISMKDRKDLHTAEELVALSPDCMIISCPNWKIIPIENLVASLHGKTKLLVEVANAQEARLTLETLELGADGIVLKTTNEKELAEVSKIAREIKTRIEEKEGLPQLVLSPAKVVEVKQLAMGARVCVDTCDLMMRGEGMLIGSQSSGLFLVQAEVEESPHVAPRPFRVNAGPVSLYVLTPGWKTKYLSELKAGDEVLIVNRHGKTRSAVVGRVKIEWRPLALIEAEFRGKRFRTIVQNAETIRLVTPDGSKSVTSLKPDNLVFIRVETGGRHFGTLVKEESVLER